MANTTVQLKDILYGVSLGAGPHANMWGKSKLRVMHGLAGDMGIGEEHLTNLIGGGMINRPIVATGEVLDDQRGMRIVKRLHLLGSHGWKLWDFKGVPQGMVQVVWLSLRHMPPYVPSDPGPWVLSDSAVPRTTTVVRAESIRWECNGAGDVILWRQVANKNNKPIPKWGYDN